MRFLSCDQGNQTNKMPEIEEEEEASIVDMDCTQSLQSNES